MRIVSPGQFWIGLLYVALGFWAVINGTGDIFLFFAAMGIAMVVTAFLPRANLERPREFLQGRLRVEDPRAFFEGLWFVGLGGGLKTLGVGSTAVDLLFVAAGGCWMMLGLVPKDFKYKRIPNVPLLLAGLVFLALGGYLFVVVHPDRGAPAAATGAVLFAASLVPERGPDRGPQKEHRSGSDLQQ